jgi:hypothetical protein
MTKWATLFLSPFQILAERYRQKYPLGSAYVKAYEARPMLHVRPERNRRHQPLSFVKAVSQDPNPTTDELIPAYRVAGESFIGQMRDLFIILDDDEAKKQPAKAGSQKKKKKRQASGEGDSDVKRKSMPSTQ